VLSIRKASPRRSAPSQLTVWAATGALSTAGAVVKQGPEAVKFRHTGQPIELPWTGSRPDAHSPENVRSVLRRHLVGPGTPPNPPVPLTIWWRTADIETPWRGGKVFEPGTQNRKKVGTFKTEEEPAVTFRDVHARFHAVRNPVAPAQPYLPNCYRFGFGLGLYLNALCFGQPAEKQAISQFMALALQNPWPDPPIGIMNQFETRIATIQRINEVPGLIPMLKQWLALTATEFGFDFQARATLKPWFQIQ